MKKTNTFLRSIRARRGRMSGKKVIRVLTKEDINHTVKGIENVRIETQYIKLRHPKPPTIPDPPTDDDPPKRR